MLSTTPQLLSPQRERPIRNHSLVLARVNILGKSILGHVSPLIHPGEERRELTPLTLMGGDQQWGDRAKNDLCPKRVGERQFPLMELGCF